MKVKFSNLKVEKIRRKLRSNKTIAATAREIGCSTSMVWKIHHGYYKAKITPVKEIDNRIFNVHSMENWLVG